MKVVLQRVNPVRMNAHHVQNIAGENRAWSNAKNYVCYAPMSVANVQKNAEV